MQSIERMYTHRRSPCRTSLLAATITDRESKRKQMRIVRVLARCVVVRRSIQQLSEANDLVEICFCVVRVHAHESIALGAREMKVSSTLAHQH